MRTQKGKESHAGVVCVRERKKEVEMPVSTLQLLPEVPAVYMLNQSAINHIRGR